MNELDRPIGRVWRRLRAQRFLASAVWCLAAGLALATVVLGVEKLGNVAIPGAAWWPFAIAGGLSVVAAGLIAALTGPDRTAAALALDHAFGLNERLSTALTLPEALRETPAGRALIADAIRHVDGLDVSDRFGLRLPRLAWLPIVPVLIAGAILLVPEWSSRQAGRATASGSSKAEDKKVVAKESSALGKKMAEQRKAMDKQKFAEADRLLAEVEKAANDLAKAPPAEKDKAMVAMNKLTETLKDRQKQLGSPEQVNRQLQQLKEMTSSGPADDFSKALAKGDFDKAAKELKELKEKLASGKMSEKDKQALKQQVGEMAKQLEKLANLDQRKKQLEEARKNGGLSKEQFDKEMAKLEDQAKNLAKVQKMAQQLAKAEEALQKGDAKKAAEALGMSEQQLAKMAQEVSEMQSLESAMADLQQAKEGMNGEGNEGDNQFGDGFNQLGQNGNRRNRGDGQGGRGQGEGPRAEAPDNVASYNSKTKNQYGKGAAIVEGTAPPTSQSKGFSTFNIQGEIEASSTGTAADALTNQKVPKSVEKHIRGYFDQINKGQN